MAKCAKCGNTILVGKITQLKDATICGSCYKALGVKNISYPEYLTFDEIKDGYQALVERNQRKAASKKEYFFLVHDLDVDFIEKYRRKNTDREDLWEGMSFNDIRENCYEGEKIYRYPELDLDIDFRLTTVDDKPAMEIYLDDHMVGYVPKTKVNNVKQLLIENKPWDAVLYGGDYQYLKGTFVDEFFDKVNIKVTFTWYDEEA